MTRTGRVERQTAETKVLVEIDLDGHGVTDVSTGVGFYDHMLTSFGRHGLFDLRIEVEGDLHIDATTPSRTRRSHWARRSPRRLVTRRAPAGSATR